MSFSLTEIGLPDVVHYLAFISGAQTREITMSNLFKIVPSTAAQTADAAEAPAVTWEICILFQKKTSEALVIPCQGKCFTKGSGNRTLAEQLSNAKDAGYNPLNIAFSKLDDGSGIEQTLRTHKACWHKLC